MEKEQFEQELLPEEVLILSLEHEVKESGWKQKDTFYFGHDYNARNDPKCKALMRRYGIAGYGTFWVIVEMMRAEAAFELPYNQMTIETIADECRIDVEEADKIVSFCIEVGLLVKDDERSTIWSWSLKGRMIPNEKKKLGRARGGKNSGGKPKKKAEKPVELSPEISPILSTTLESKQENTTSIHANSQELESEQLTVSLTEISLPKEKKRKGKEIKENINYINISRAREKPPDDEGPISRKCREIIERLQLKNMAIST
jgi:hypothetical protein